MATDTFDGSAGALANPPWEPFTGFGGTVNRDGSGNARAAATLANVAVKHASATGTRGHKSKCFVSFAGGAAENYIDVGVRMTATDAYFAELGDDGLTSVFLYRVIAGAFSAVLTTWTLGAPFANGDSLEVEVDDAAVGLPPTFILRHNDVAVGSPFTDSGGTYPSGTQVGFGVYAANTVNDVLVSDWAGGDVKLVPVGIPATKRPAGFRGPRDRRGFLRSRVWDWAIAAVAAAITIAPDVGSLVIDGFAPTVSTPITVTPGTGALQLDGFAPSLQAAVNVTPGVGSLVLTGFSPSIGTPRTLTPGVGSLVLTGLAPSMGLPLTVRPDVGALLLSGFAPAVQSASGILPGVGALSLTGFAPTVGIPRTLTPGTGALALAGLAPAVALPVTARPGVGALVLAGLAPSLAVGAPDLLVLGSVDDLTPAIIARDFTPAVVFRDLTPEVMTDDLTPEVVVSDVTPDVIARDES